MEETPLAAIALANFEIFHGMEYTATLADVQQTSAGILGWANLNQAYDEDTTLAAQALADFEIFHGMEEGTGSKLRQIVSRAMLAFLVGRSSIHYTMEIATKVFLSNRLLLGGLSIVMLSAPTDRILRAPPKKN